MRVREPLVWGLGLALVWIAAVAVIALAAGDAEPSVAAGSVVTALAVTMCVIGGIAGGIGRPFEWSRWFAVAVAGTLSAATLVATVLRWRWDAVIFVPIVGLVSGMIGWAVTWLGWLAGGVVRVMLGHEERDHSL